MATNIMETPPEDLGDPDDFIEGLMDAANYAFDKPADESKQPFKENYNRLFKGRDVL